LAELYIEQGRFEDAEAQLDLAKGFNAETSETAELMKFVHERSKLKTKTASSQKILHPISI
jgi:hypothetical protein